MGATKEPWTHFKDRGGSSKEFTYFCFLKPDTMYLEDNSRIAQNNDEPNFDWFWLIIIIIMLLAFSGAKL